MWKEDEFQSLPASEDEGISEIERISENVDKAIGMVLSPRISFEEVVLDEPLEVEGILISREDQPGEKEEKPLRRGIVNLVNSTIGAGVLGTPFAFKSSGFLLGMFLVVLLGIITRYTMHRLLESGLLCSRDSYEEVGQYVFPKAGRYLVGLPILLNCFGSVCAYCIITGDMMQPIISEIVGENSFFARKDVLSILFIVTVALPLCLKRQIDALSATSTLSICLVFIFVLVVIIKAFFPSDSEVSGEEYGFQAVGKNHVNFIRFDSDVFLGLPIIIFAFTSHPNMFPVYTELRPQTESRMKRLIKSTISICAVVYVIVGLFGYFSFYEHTDDDLLNNYPGENFLINIVRMCIAITVLLTYPLVNYPLRCAILSAPQWLSFLDPSISLSLFLSSSFSFSHSPSLREI
eukprot:GCRY01004523.1.p1 GENE.GCRY01004523.1~~GCRY01004523.1.p1  ORF type:complete len:406 (+),score=81.05 GCRY01004523.1:194-1411(+)